MTTQAEQVDLEAQPGAPVLSLYEETCTARRRMGIIKTRRPDDVVVIDWTTGRTSRVDLDNLRPTGSTATTGVARLLTSDEAAAYAYAAGLTAKLKALR